MFQGVFTALLTPFKKGKVDERAYQSFVEWQIKEGVHGVVPCGTTGESPTLDYDEHNRVISLCVEAARRKVPVIAGTGSNSTDEAIFLTRHAKKAGATAALIVAPYYNKPTQEGLYQHYKAIHDAVDIPIIIYNVPARTVVDIKDETIARLAKLPNIVAVKDASGNLARVSILRDLAGEKFCQLSGEDMTSLSFNAAGGKGVISVTSNIAPRLCAEEQNAWFAGDAKKALKIHDKLVGLHNVMFCETSPGPVKYAASLLGLCSAEMRMPLVEISKESKALVKEALKNAGLLKSSKSKAA